MKKNYNNNKYHFQHNIRKTNVPFHCRQPWLLGFNRSLSRPRWVDRVSPSQPCLTESSSCSYGASSSDPRRVIESSSSRGVKSSRPRRVWKYRLQIRGSIYLFLSVGRKMTLFPETVSDQFSQRNGASSSHPRRVIKWRRVPFVESWRASVSIYLFLSVGRKMTLFPETVSDPTKNHKALNPELSKNYRDAINSKHCVKENVSNLAPRS